MSYHKNKMLCRMVSQFSRHDIGPRYDGAKKLLHGFLLKGRRWIACAHVTSCTCVTVAKACSSFIHLNPFSSSDFEKNIQNTEQRVHLQQRKDLPVDCLQPEKTKTKTKSSFRTIPPIMPWIFSFFLVFFVLCLVFQPTVHKHACRSETHKYGKSRWTRHTRRGAGGSDIIIYHHDEDEGGRGTTVGLTVHAGGRGIMLTQKYMENILSIYSISLITTLRSMY